MNNEPPMESREQQLSDALKREMQRETESLDEVTKAKLAAARHRATATDSNRWSFLRPWTLGAGLASFALLMMIVLPNLTPPTVTNIDEPQLTNTATVLEDLSILAASDGVEFYQSVDFLLWLENNAGSEG